MDKQITKLFEDLKSDIIQKLSNPIDEQDKEFQQKFDDFINHLSENYFNIFSENSSEEKNSYPKTQLLSPIGNLLKPLESMKPIFIKL